MPPESRTAMWKVEDPKLPFHEAVCRRLRSVERNRDGKVLIHAAAAQLPSGVGILAPGRSRAGKSTLMGVLARDLNAAVVADDLVVLDEHLALGIGAPIVLRSSSPVWPDARRLWYGRDGERMAVRPEDLGGSTLLSMNVDVVVHLMFGSELTVTPIAPAASFAAILAMLVRPATDEQLMAIAQHVGKVPSLTACYEDVADSRHAIDLVASSARSEVSIVEPRRLDDHELGEAPEGCWGIRFGHDVVLLRRGHHKVALLSDWPPGSVGSLESWSRLVGSGP